MSFDALDGWTPIAVRSRTANKNVGWAELPGAPITLEEAGKACAGGQLLKCLKFEADNVFVVVRRRVAT